MANLECVGRTLRRFPIAILNHVSKLSEPLGVHTSASNCDKGSHRNVPRLCRKALVKCDTASSQSDVRSVSQQLLSIFQVQSRQHSENIEELMQGFTMTQSYTKANLAIFTTRIRGRARRICLTVGVSYPYIARRILLTFQLSPQKAGSNMGVNETMPSVHSKSSFLMAPK